MKLLSHRTAVRSTGKAMSLPMPSISFLSNSMLRSTAPISRTALGTYRMTIDSAENLRAAYLALTRQSDPRLVINTIDTSTNYMNGGAERMIGHVLTNPEQDTLQRKEIHLATKYGYIQGDNMQLYEQGFFNDVPKNHVVKYMPGCYHCIHPAFMRYQIKLSLERLKTDYVDTLFIHNPEYFLMHNIVVDQDPGTKINCDIKGLQNQMVQRIGFAFEGLEEEIQKGTIRSYGISSNSFSKLPEHPHFLPYKPLIEMAKRAANKVRGSSETHGFSAIQMPGNFLEQDGIKMTAKWAHQNGLKVFVNRPLNAIASNGSFRLSSYPVPSPTYDHVRDGILARFNAIMKASQSSSPQSSSPPRNYLAADRMAAFIYHLDSQLPHHTSVLSLDMVRPQIFSEMELILSEMKGKVPEEWINWLKQYLETYESEVRWRGTRYVEKYMGAKGVDLNGRKIEEAAIEFLLEEEGVDCVLLGMTKSKYVESARSILKDLEV